MNERQHLKIDNLKKLYLMGCDVNSDAIENFNLD